MASIASGVWQPGQRVPVRRAMAVQYGATIVTIQKALAELERSGIVRSDGWQGTFVSRRPPCLCRFGLLLPDPADADGSYPSRFYTSLAMAVREHGRQPEAEWVVYDDLLAGGSARKRLRKDLAGHHLAGLAVVFARPMLPLVREILPCQVPIMQIGGPAAEPGCQHLDYDRAALASLVSSRLLAAGSRRPMVAVLANIDQAHFTAIRAILHQQGIDPAPGAIMGFDHAHTAWIHEWMPGQWSRPAGQRPDGMLILDDNFIEAASLGLGGLGLIPGRDLPVVAYSNLPYHHLPSGFLGVGCDSRVILKLAQEGLRAARGGGPVPAVLIPMRSADEPA